MDLRAAPARRHTANEDLLEALGRYYDLPSISLRNVIWHAVKENVTFHGLRLHQASV